MGAIKNHAMEVASLYYEFGQKELKQRLRKGSIEEVKNIFYALPYARMNMDRNGFFIDRREPAKLSQKVFIGGEGIEENELFFCKECLTDFNLFLGLSWKFDSGVEVLTNELLPHLTITFQNDLESCPVDEPEFCNCGNWLWDKVGHDILLEYVANGDISPEVATAWINRNLSHNLDTRAYNRDFIASAIREWESRWQA